MDQTYAVSTSAYTEIKYIRWVYQPTGRPKNTFIVDTVTATMYSEYIHLQEDEVYTVSTYIYILQEDQVYTPTKSVIYKNASIQGERLCTVSTCIYKYSAYT